MRSLVTHVQAGWQKHAAVENLGLGGACVAIDERLTPGDAVTLSFTAPSLWDPLVLRARVGQVVSDVLFPVTGLTTLWGTISTIRAVMKISKLAKMPAVGLQAGPLPGGMAFGVHGGF